VDAVERAIEMTSDIASLPLSLLLSIFFSLVPAVSVVSKDFIMYVLKNVAFRDSLKLVRTMHTAFS